MHGDAFFQAKTYLLTALAVITFSQFVVQLFSQTIPGTVLTFFKDAGDALILGAVFLFAFAWLLKAKPQKKPKSYSIVVFDVFGRETVLDGIRTEFGRYDVAWSFMKGYKISHPLYNFALVADLPKSEKRTIFRYI